MTQWCLEHPFLTFFIALAALEAAVILARGYNPYEYQESAGEEDSECQ
jgi:hypothetical protein